MTKYIKEFTIPYYDTDSGGLLRSEAILAYMAETSSWHSDSLGVGHKLLNSKGYGWMLNRWEAEFIGYPKAKDNVVIETWTSSFDRFYATREFTMKNAEGKILAKAATQWIFLDMNKKKPVRIPLEIQERYSFVDENHFEGYTQLKSFESSDGSLITVRRSDIDTNQHVNNIRYVEWMQEGIPDKIIDNKRISKLAANYRKEVLPGDTVLSSIRADDERADSYWHVISVNGETNAIGFTQWK
jgi:acyl-ACP thioesterase